MKTHSLNQPSSLHNKKPGPSETELTNNFGVELPGITIESQEAVLKLLDQNHKNFDIFFNDKGFHNHCVHHLLAAYSCGASPERLESIYKKFANYLKPRKPSKTPITQENWTNHLGSMDMWTDYFNFFEGIVKEQGMTKAFETYAFHPQMISRVFGGAFHPIIHIGYGFEFQIPLIVAEGLAEAAISQNRFEELINDKFFTEKGIENKKIMDIITEVQNDSNFDHIITHSDDIKLKIVVNERVDAIRDYASKWNIPETEEGIKQAAQELYETCALAYGATAIRPDKKVSRLDFFLMHGLTSMLFVYIMLPFFDLTKRIKMLRAEFAAVLTYYIARGRPRLFLDHLEKFTPQKLKVEPNPWLDVIKHALEEEEEPHVIKVIRSLLKANQEWGPDKDDLFVKIAQLTVEGYEKYGWSMNGLGFDEEWKEESILDKVKEKVAGLASYLEKKEK